MCFYEQDSLHVFPTEIEYYPELEIRREIGLSPNLMGKLGVKSYDSDTQYQNQRWVPPRRPGLMNSAPMIKTKGNDREREVMKLQRKFRSHLAKEKRRKLKNSRGRYDAEIDPYTGLPVSMGDENFTAVLALNTHDVDSSTDWAPSRRGNSDYSRPMIRQSNASLKVGKTKRDTFHMCDADYG